MWLRKAGENGIRTRKFLGLPIGGKQTVFQCKLQRYKCNEKDCDFDRQQEITFAHGSKTYIKRVVPYVVDLLKIGTIKDSVTGRRSVGRKKLVEWLKFIHNYLIITYKVTKICHSAKFLKHLFY